jgi:hypothetical protein
MPLSAEQTQLIAKIQA